MKYVRTHGLILRVRHGRNKDRIITLLTPDRGKITVVARGSRDMKSKNCAVMNEHHHISCQLYFGRGIPIITQTKLLKSYLKTRDIHLLSYLSYLAETVEILMEEENFVDKIYPLVEEAFDVVDQNNYTVVLPFFTLKLLTTLGYIQQMNICSNCRNALRDSKKAYLDSSCNVICEDCKNENNKEAPLKGVKLLFFCQQNNLSDLLKIDIPKNLQPFFAEISQNLFATITNRERKSEKFLKSFYLLSK